MMRSMRALANAVILVAGLACVANAQAPAVGGAARVHAAADNADQQYRRDRLNLCHRRSLFHVRRRRKLRR
jgi:hypothetical protein